MANSNSARKRIRRNEARRQINHARKGRMRTFIKRVESALQAGDAEAARGAFRQAQPEIHRAATKGVIHPNAAARKLSRLQSRIKKLAQGNA